MRDWLFPIDLKKYTCYRHSKWEIDKALAGLHSLRPPRCKLLSMPVNLISYKNIVWLLYFTSLINRNL